MAKRKGLGRGLNALISEVPVEQTTDEAQTGTKVALDQIDPNRFQPRQEFEAEPLEDLVASIKEHGVLQPLVVRKREGRFELIAGERRLRASGEAGLTEVPVRIIQVDDQGALELALIENLQRENLGILEEAEGYRRLMKEFGLSQDQVSKKVSKARATVANALRILTLPDACKKLLNEGTLSAGHAKVLLSLDGAQAQEDTAKQIVRDSLSVRAAEKLIAQQKKPGKKPRAKKSDIPQEHLDYLVEELHQHFNTSVRVVPCQTLANGKKTPGRLEIDYFSSDELDGILQKLGLSEQF